MPDRPPPTPLSAASIRSAQEGGNGVQVSDLLGYLQAIVREASPVDETLAHSHGTQGKASQDAMSLINELAEHVLTNFPRHGPGVWSTIHDKIRLCSASLDVMQRMAGRTTGTFRVTEQRATVILQRIVAFMSTLWGWPADTNGQRPGVDSVLELRMRVVRAFGALSISFDKTEKCSLLRGMLRTCHELFDVFTTDSWPHEQSMVIDSSNGTIKIVFKIENVEELCNALQDLLWTLLKPVEHCLQQQDHKSASLLQRYTTLLHQMHAFLQSSSNPSSFSQRCSALAVLVQQSCLFRNLLTNAEEGTVDSIPTSILISRLRNVDEARNWSALDEALAEAFRSSAIHICPASSSVLIAELTIQCESDSMQQAKEVAQDALLKMLPMLAPRCVESINLLLSGCQDPTFDALKASAVASQQMPHSGADVTSPLLGKRKRSEESWRSQVTSTLRPAIFQHNEELVVGGSELSDNDWIVAVLEKVKRRLTRDIHDAPSDSRVQAVVALKHLACRIAHPELDECNDTPPTKQGQALSLLPTYIASVKSLMGDQVGMSPEVERTALDALAMGLRHHSQGFSEETHESVFVLVITSLKARNRSLRLAAGRALKALLSLYERIGLGTRIRRHVKSVFTTVEEILLREGDPVKETTLISLGTLGRNSDSEILESVLFILFSQLDCSSILLRGIAYMQLVGLAKFYKKTPYALVSPHLRRIAIFIVNVMSHQPNALLETCRFLSLSPRDFLSVTLPYSLPYLFGTCNAHALSALQRELGRPLSSLILNNSSEVLAHIFLLEGTQKTEKAVAFILDTLNEAASDAISVANLVKSCMMPLLGNLVIAMGDQDTSQADAAKHAIRKVERYVSDSTNDRDTRDAPVQHLGNFLKNYILGIIAILNDILQEVQGRKSNEVKCKVLSGLGALIQEVGPTVIAVAPQIMATLQTTLSSPALATTSLQTWHYFFKTLSLEDMGQYVGPTTAALVNAWPSLTPFGRDAAKGILSYIFTDASSQIDQFVNEVADFSSVPDLKSFSRRIRELRARYSVSERLERILERMDSDNSVVVRQALEELRTFMLQFYPSIIAGIATGDVFHPLVGSIVRTLLTVICRDTEGADALRLIAFECLGVLGAADPDRFSITIPDRNKVVLGNYTDEEEAIQFALYLVENTLVSAYRSTSDIKYQSHVAFAIQELLKFCKFTPSLAFPGHGPSSSLKTRNRWNHLPKHVLETVTPLLESRFSAGNIRESAIVQHPIYPSQETYREWLQLWVSYLITRTSGSMARTIFTPFRLAVRNKDVGVARQLLPHLVLNILISGTTTDVQEIHQEIVSVLEDQIDESTLSTPEKRLLSAQVVFMLMDHLNRWLRIIRLANSSKRTLKKKGRDSEAAESEIQIVRVASLLGEINQVLIAKAAFRCQSYARSLMNFEKQIIKDQAESEIPSQENLQPYYERLHEIYSHLDEPDGMEGIADFIVLPSLEHQIRQHESTGKWTSAQSCWEVRLQQEPNRLDYHLGLLRCLRNLGHYDSLRTHIQGILIRKPEWESSLSGFRIEGAWMNDDWDSVRRYTENGEDTWEASIARILLAMKEGGDEAFIQASESARLQLGKPVIAGGEAGYRRSYDAVLKLHLVRDIECIRGAIRQLKQGGSKAQILPDLFSLLSQRTATTLPNFRTREPLLSAHRTAFSLSNSTRAVFKRAVGRAWLDSAKLARKAGHWQTAYSAVLQAQESHEPLTFYQSAKLVKETGEPLRALHELDNALRTPTERQQMLTQGVIDLSEDMDSDDAERKRVEAKARLLRARWMRESERFDANVVAKELQDLARELKDLESAHFHAGHFQDENFKRLGSEKNGDRGQRMNVFTVKEYVTAVQLGSKYAYQTIPRVLTLWLDMGENVGKFVPTRSKKPEKSSSQRSNSADYFAQMNDILKHSMGKIPIYKWLSAFPQIVSRVDHANPQVYEILGNLILLILQEYPQQGLWSFVSVLNSTKAQRKDRGREILHRLRQSKPRTNGVSVPDLVINIDELAKQLLQLCNFNVHAETKSLALSNHFRGLARLAPSPLIIPLQESMTVTFPSSSSSESVHQPFPLDAPTIEKFDDEVIVMKTLAKPRRISLKGSDGRTYLFLGKPKDDLRKDARLMDFNSIINKLLKTNSDSRRRQLHIRTYSVVTLNEECGFIQWVPNTQAIRALILPYYASRGVGPWDNNIKSAYDKMKTLPDKQAADIFENQVLKAMPPVFHEWFLDAFPEPSAWLSSRLSYGRTIAVMSMVGFILGLGDRHLENILLDVNSGDAVHVDFNCLFEKGKLLEVPERTPFRLTQNLIDALGVTGVEGVFRKAAEITMQLLRDNKDVLMSVLDAFIHDPLVEWEDERRKLERRRKDPQGSNEVKDSVNLRSVAKLALVPIEKKLKGVYSKDANNRSREKESTTSNLVQALIEEATDLKNLAKMYVGWAAWH